MFKQLGRGCLSDHGRAAKLGTCTNSSALLVHSLGLAPALLKISRSSGHPARLRWRGEGLWLPRPEHPAPTRSSTVLDIGSLLKPITGAAILKLEAEGRLNTSESAFRARGASASATPSPEALRRSWKELALRNVANEATRTRGEATWFSSFLSLGVETERDDKQGGYRNISA
jgi:hypothetical protein